VAFIALLLGIPMIGLTTVDQGGALRIATRWPALSLIRRRLLRRSPAAALYPRPPAGTPAGARAGGGGGRERSLASSPLLTWVGWGALGVSLLLPIVFSDNRYVVDTATTVLIYVMLGWGLNVVVGLAGLLDLGYVAFYAVGAYTYGVLATHFGWGFWQALPVAGAMAASFGILLGWPTLRLRGDYLAIVTLGFGEIIRVILVNWTELSGGPNGITSIPRPSFFGLPFKPPGDDPTFASFFGLEYSPTTASSFSIT
jgi:branched-chain amino acid transport system permease protein